MKRTLPSMDSTLPAATQCAGQVALETYSDTLAFITMGGSSRRLKLSPQEPLPFLQNVECLENLYRSMSAVAPAVPDADDEEWNPVSQRPHSPLPPAISDELGSEISSMKEAIDAFTTLAHEMMHVAHWEPFFTGKWQPRNRGIFREFMLMSEGFCFFFADIIVSGTVRERLPDGEFAQVRQTPSNADFHPVRAFNSLGITDHQEILNLYLDGFTGKTTPLTDKKGTNDYGAAIAKRLHDFYSHSLPYLDKLHSVLNSFGGLKDFYKRFCAIPGLPGLLQDREASLALEGDFKKYFMEFHSNGLSSLARLTPKHVLRVRWRRMLQMRAYYALQIVWLIAEGQVIGLPAPACRKILPHIEFYLEALRLQLHLLAQQPDYSPLEALVLIDAQYDTFVRALFLSHDAWVGQRWLIAPERAGGQVSVFENAKAKINDLKIELLETVSFLVEELTERMKEAESAEERVEKLGQIQELATLGAVCFKGSVTQIRSASKKLRVLLAKPHNREIWSLPLSAFHPVANVYRELMFSYK